ncbi:MAG TPA: hypothetical protein VHF22_04315 [Planctomycetota bacterium]|nr:hypothetical protein [Planctomycetota bacterium]
MRVSLKIISTVLAAAALGSATPVLAQQAATPTATPSAEERIERLERELEILKRKQFEAEEGGGAPAAGGADRTSAAPPKGAEGPIKGSIPERATESIERSGTKGGVYAKPFLARFARGAYLGGYMDFEYRDEQGTDRFFRQLRFIPFIYADVTEHLKVAAEIEFEGGGVSDEHLGEAKIEFAFADYVFSEAVALRVGAVLMPLGKFNLIHDSPVNDLTDRPLVDQFVIPTTYTQPAAGFYGSLYPVGEAKLDYEVYLTNGVQGLVKDETGALEANIHAGLGPEGVTTIDGDGGLRDARPDFEDNVNNSLAGVGRVALSPVLGVEVGLSALVTRYDQHVEKADWLTLWALDATIQFGRFATALEGLELQGEFARADISRGDGARAAGIPGHLVGGYAQANYHFMLDALKQAAPVVFGPESTFTAVLRFDWLGDERTAVADTQMITPGLNFRPTEDTVFKLEYQIQLEDWNREKVENDAFVCSFATYF